MPVILNIVAVALAYFCQSQYSDNITKAHTTYLIHTFWKGAAISAALTVTFVFLTIKILFTSSATESIREDIKNVDTSGPDLSGGFEVLFLSFFAGAISFLLSYGFMAIFFIGSVVWYYGRNIKGFSKVSNEETIYNPKTWWI